MSDTQEPSCEKAGGRASGQAACEELLKQLVEVAAGRSPADVVLKGAAYANVFTGEVLRADIAIACGVIAGLGTYSGVREIDVSGRVVIPGFIDPHIHLESAMVSPAEFARAVLPHGTTAVVADPHEIVNVMGEAGLDYMLQATEGLPVEAFFTLPSCVPATPFDENGADLDYRRACGLLGNPRVLGLAEMMNYPGVVAGDSAVLGRIAAAHSAGGVVDGHAPGLSGADLCAYVAAGVRSDHECSTPEEALEKLRLGMRVMIREGTAARNFDALAPIVREGVVDRLMFCCDDKHPGDLAAGGHIDVIVRRAIRAGVDPVAAVRIATLNPARCFGMRDRGAVAPGYIADLVVVDDLQSLSVMQVYKRGELVYAEGSLGPIVAPQVDALLMARACDTFRVRELSASDFAREGQLAVVGMVPGEIVTRDCGFASGVDPSRDILKVAVVERHRMTGHIGVGYLQGYGLRRGAVATSISHDSHNIIVVGENDEDMARAANEVAARRGGMAVADGGRIVAFVPLPIAGLMSAGPLAQVCEELAAAKAAAHERGVARGIDPVMTLGFMSLTVIPELRVTTRGVFDVRDQAYVDARGDGQA